MRAIDQHPARPFLPHQVLRQRVGEHAARRRDVDHVVAAVLLAQCIVGRLDVEQRDLLRAAGIGKGQKPVAREDRQHQHDAAVQPGRAAWPPGRRRRGPARPTSSNCWIDEATGRIVVGDGELRAGEPVVRRRLVEQRNCLARLEPAQVADLNSGGIGTRGTRHSGKCGTRRGCDQGSPAEPVRAASALDVPFRPAWSTLDGRSSSATASGSPGSRSSA